MAQSYITYAGCYAEKAGAGWYHEPGPGPSRGWIILSDEDAASLKFTKQGADFVFCFEGKPTTIRHILIESFENHDVGLTKVNLVDTRVFWSRRYYSGIFNHLMDNGQTYHVKSTYNGTDPWTFRQIVDELVSKIKTVSEGHFKPSAIYDSAKLDAIDSTNNPLVLMTAPWEVIPAAQALQTILNLVGFSLSIDFDGNITISSPDDDHFSSKKKSLEIQSETKPRRQSEINKPDKIKVRYHILREKLFKNQYWEPVMHHDGRNADFEEFEDTSKPKAGEWCSVETVLKDWGLSEDDVKRKFYFLHEVFDTKDKPGLRGRLDAIRKEFYRYFRYQPPTTTSEESRLQILPFHSTLGSVGEDISQLPIYLLPRAVKTVTATQKKKGEDSEIVDSYIEGPGKVRVEDADLGIIYFPTTIPVAKHLSSSGSERIWRDMRIDKPDIRVVLAFRKKFISSSGLENDYHTEEIKDSWTGIAGNGQTAEVLDESQFYIERDIDASGTYTAFNSDVIESYAQLYAEDFFKAQTAALKGSDATDIDAIGYEPSINRLCGKLRGIELYGDGSRGFGATYRVGLDMPINPFSRNLARDLRGIGGVGETISTAGSLNYQRLNLPRPSAVDERHKGILGYCTDLGRRDLGHDAYHRVGFINPQDHGLVVAMDLPFSGIDIRSGKSDKKKKKEQHKSFSDIDHRTKHVRVKEISGDGGSKYDRVGKLQEAWNDARHQWDPGLILPELKTSPAPPKASPVISGGGSNQDVRPSPYRTTSSRPTSQPTKTVDGIERSVAYFEKDPEPHKTRKGYVRQLHQVATHRYYGKDEDGNIISRAEVDKNLAYYHRSDDLCGPRMDGGAKKRPPPIGHMIYAEEVFDKGAKAWGHVAYVDMGNTPTVPPPAGSPKPVPHPAPNPAPNPQPQPIPTGGGGNGRPPGWHPGAGRGGGNGGGGGSGSPVGGWPSGAIGEGEGVIPVAPVSTFPKPPFGGVPILPDTPGLEGPYFERLSGLGNPATDANQIGRLRARGVADGDPLADRFNAFSGDGSLPSPDGSLFRDMLPAEYSALPFNAPINRLTVIPTAGTNKKQSPYRAGTAFDRNAPVPNRRQSAYAAGSGGFPRSYETAFDLDEIPSSHAWDDTTISDERISDDEWKRSTMLGQIQALTNLVNLLSSRIETLDARNRANFNVADEVSIPFLAATASYTTSHAYSSAPYIQATNPNDPATWDPGNLSVHGYTQNADGTYTVTVECENANNSGGALTIALDIKGAVADNEDIDP